MAHPPPLSPPRLGDPIRPDGELAYGKRASAHRQAVLWNIQLQEDPVYGLASGMVVGVSPVQIDRRWELVWVARGELEGHG